MADFGAEAFHLDVAVEGEAGAAGDEVAEDDVFLEAAQLVDAAHGGGLGEDAGGVLEGGRGDEGVGLEGGLGDAQEGGFAFGGAFAFLGHLGVDLFEDVAGDLLAVEEVGVARVLDADFAEHLADDDLDVFVVDLDFLEAVDLLDFVDEVFLELLGAADVEDFLRGDGAFGELLPAADVVVLEDDDLLGHGDEVLFGDAGDLVFDDEDALAALVVAEVDDAVDAGDFGDVFGGAGLEELGDAGEAAGDVAGLVFAAGGLGEGLAGLDEVAVGDHDGGAGGDGVDAEGVELGGVEAVGVDGALGELLDDEAGVEGGAAVGDDAHPGAGGLVEFGLDGDAFLEVLLDDDAGVVGDDGDGVGVPGGDAVALVDFAVVLDGEGGAHLDGVGFELVAFLVGDGDGAVFVEDDELALLVADDAEVAVAEEAFALDDDLGGLGDGGGGAADVEGAHGQLGAGLADGLGGDDADGGADLDGLAGGEVAAVAFGAHAVLAVAGEAGADPDLLDAGLLDGGGLGLVDLVVGLDDDGVGLGVADFVEGGAPDDAFGEGELDLVAFDDGLDLDAGHGVAVLLGDDDVLGDVDELARHVAGVGGLEGGVGEALTGAVGGDEVFEDGEAFAEGGGDGRLDDLAVGLGHEAAHAGELADLGARAAGLGVGHHVDGVDVGGLGVVGRDVALDGLVEGVGDALGGGGPDVGDLALALAFGDDALLELLGDLGDFLFGGLEDLVLVGGADHVLDAHGGAGLAGPFEAEVLELVEGLDGAVVADGLVAGEDELAEGGFGDLVVPEAHLLGPDLVEDDAADEGDEDLGLGVAVGALGLAEVGVLEPDAVVDLEGAVVEGELDLGGGAEEGEAVGDGVGLDAAADGLAGVLVGLGGDGEEVAPEGDVLGRGLVGVAAGGGEDGVGREHEEAALELGLDGEGDVHGHLVAVEVGVEGGADHGVEADGLAFDEDGLEGLDGEAVEGGGAVEHDGLAAGDLLEDVPDLGLLLLDHLLGGAHGVAEAKLLEAADDEGLEEGEGHLLGQAALVELEVGAHDDDGAARVVHALAQEVLAEAAGLALEHVAEGFEGAPAGAGDGAAVAAVVEDRVDGFLEHPLLVAEDDLGGLELEEVLEAVVAVDDAAVEVVEVAGGEAPAFEGDEGAELGRDDGEGLEDHPLGLGAGGAEALDDLHALGDFLAGLLGAGVLDLLLQLLHERVEVDAAEAVADDLGAHAGLEGVEAVFVEGLVVLGLGEELELLEGGVLGVGDEVVLVVEHALEDGAGQVEDGADAAGVALEEPDVAHGHGQVDVAHALAADAREGDLHAAAVADDAFVLDALVLAAGALPVLRGAEDALAEEAVALGAVGAVVDGLGVLHLAVAPGADGVGRGQGDAHRVVLRVRGKLEQILRRGVGAHVWILRKWVKGSGTGRARGRRARRAPRLPPRGRRAASCPGTARGARSPARRRIRGCRPRGCWCP